MNYTLTIPKRLTHGDELVVVRRRDYERLQRRLIEVKDALAKIRLGNKDFRDGKTRLVKSLAELRS